MRTIDQIATEEFNLSILSMMENAGRGLATLAARKLRGLGNRRVLCLAGKGGNGGGGLVASRHLANWGARLEVVALEPPPGTEAEIHARTLRKAGVSVKPPRALPRIDVRSFDVVLDAVLGYSLSGNPRGDAADLVRAANAANHVIALDLPSGLDPDRGNAGKPCVRATATLTLALPKRGLLERAAAPYVGELWLGDLGIPPAVFVRLGLRVPLLFRPGQVLRRLSSTRSSHRPR